MRVMLLAAFAMMALISEVSAQPTPPSNARPTFSPYLNLLNGNNSAAYNYFGSVRPQMQFQQQFGQLQQQLQQTNNNLQQLQNNAQGVGDPTLPATGHGAVFNATGRYFSSNPAQGAGRFGGLGASGQGRTQGFGSVPGRQGSSSPRR